MAHAGSDERMLVHVDGGSNSNKFYHMKVTGSTLTCTWGRVGTRGRTTTYSAGDYARLLREKLSHGYVDITDNWNIGRPLDGAPVPSTSRPDATPGEQLIATLLRHSREWHDRSLSVSLDTVTDLMVRRQEDILAQIGAWAASGAANVEMASFLFTQLYTNIPRRMNDTSLWYPQTVDDITRLRDREWEYLQDLKQSRIVDIAASKHGDGSRERSILDSFSLTVEPVDEATERMIRSMMGSAAASYRRAWRVTNASTEDAFRRWCQIRHITDGGTRLLWHGSRNENWLNILSFGLRLKNKAVKTGSMFGHGLYFAPKALKSIGYTSIQGSAWASGSQDTAYLALYEVAYGNAYHVSTYKNIAPARLLAGGYDCLHAHAGGGMLRNDEIVVYDDCAATIRHLVEIG